MKKTLLLLAALFALSLPVLAQAPADPPKAAPVEKKSEPETFSVSHLKAAEDLMEVMDLRKIFQTQMERSIQLQLDTNPLLKKYEPVMRKFFSKYLSFDVLHNDLARLYATNFSESELIELARFYRTEVGRKALSKLPELSVQSSELGKRKVLEHLPELKDMIKEFDGKGEGKAEGN